MNNKYENILVSFDEKIVYDDSMFSYITGFVKERFGDDVNVKLLKYRDNFIDNIKHSDCLVIIKNPVRELGDGKYYITPEDSSINLKQLELVKRGASMGIPAYELMKLSKRGTAKFKPLCSVKPINIDDMKYVMISGIFNESELKDIIVYYASSKHIPVFAHTPIDAMGFAFTANIECLELMAIYNERVDVSSTLIPPVNKNGKIDVIYSKSCKHKQPLTEIENICITDIQDKFRVMDLLPLKTKPTFCSFIMNERNSAKELYLNMEEIK